MILDYHLLFSWVEGFVIFKAKEEELFPNGLLRKAALGKLTKSFSRLLKDNLGKEVKCMLFKADMLIGRCYYILKGI